MEIIRNGTRLLDSTILFEELNKLGYKFNPSDHDWFAPIFTCEKKGSTEIDVTRNFNIDALSEHEFSYSKFTDLEKYLETYGNKNINAIETEKDVDYIYEKFVQPILTKDMFVSRDDFYDDGFNIFYPDGNEQQIILYGEFNRDGSSKLDMQKNLTDNAELIFDSPLEKHLTKQYSSMELIKDLVEHIKDPDAKIGMYFK